MKEVYNAEELKIGAFGTHTYDKETKAQIKEKYWLKPLLLNSIQVSDINNEIETKKLARQLAEAILTEITNLPDDNKIEIVLMQQRNDGQVKSIKRSFFFTLPNLEETD